MNSKEEANQRLQAAALNAFSAAFSPAASHFFHEQTAAAAAAAAAAAVGSNTGCVIKS